VHLSADGELMVIHDETVDLTTNGKEDYKLILSIGTETILKWKRQHIPTLSSIKPH
jgi:glycerophosphoryl diester phosphodiesterase